MMQEILTQLVQRACAEQVVASAATADGLHLMVYPLEQGGILVGVGIEGERAQLLNPEMLLYKRSRDLERFGSWMPSLFADGSWYVARRIVTFDVDLPVLTQDDLDAAEELLA